jgi:hypothetical protein
VEERYRLDLRTQRSLSPLLPKKSFSKSKSVVLKIKPETQSALQSLADQISEQVKSYRAKSKGKD